MNPAHRIHKLLRAFINSGQSNVAAMWRVALGAQAKDGAVGEHELSVALFALREEIIKLELLLTKRGIPGDMWVSHLNRIKDFTLTASLSRNRDQVSDALRQDAQVMLQWADFYLGRLDAEEWTDAAREELNTRIAELEEALNAEGIPSAFYLFASDLLRQLKDAVTLAPIQGLAPLRTAVRKATADLYYDKDSIDAAVQEGEGNPASETLRQKAGAALVAAAKYTGEADKFVSSYSNLVGKAYGLSRTLLDYFQQS